MFFSFFKTFRSNLILLNLVFLFKIWFDILLSDAVKFIF